VFWAWAIPPEQAGPLVVACSLLGQLLTMGTIRQGFSARRAAPFILGGVAGVPLGAWLLPYIPPDGFRAGLGLLLLVWCPAMLFARDLPQVGRHGGWIGGRGPDAVAGWLGGVMGGLGGMSGPAPTLWCALRGWDKHSQRAVFQAFHTCMHTVTLAAYFFGGLLGPPTFRLFVVAAPAMLVPALLGARLYHRVSDVAFRRAVLLLLLLSGVFLLLRAVLRLL
jgi:uncharacterized membrane protein YfcA